MHQLLLIVALSLAAYRITRLAVKDTIWDTTRERLLDHLVARDPSSLWRDKLAELLSCPYCFSAWASAAVTALADQFTVVELPWLTFGAVCGGSLLVWTYIEIDAPDK